MLARLVGVSGPHWQEGSAASTPYTPMVFSHSSLRAVLPTALASLGRLYERRLVPSPTRFGMLCQFGS